MTIESLSSRLKETETQLADAILQRDRERQAKDDRTKHLHTLTKELAQANKSLRQVHLVCILGLLPDSNVYLVN